MLYIDDMLEASKIMVEMNRIKAQLARTLKMKDLGVEKKILGMEIHIGMKNGKMCLSQQKYMEKILLRFGTNNVKPVQIYLATHFNISSDLCASNDEEKVYLKSNHLNEIYPFWRTKLAGLA